MAEHNYKLSIIIPIYNCEKYIANCLNSILDSDLPKDVYEVIIINDGSEDKGPEIAQDFVSKHESFTYLTQENQGQSVARNKGIQKASGEYLWFVDGDDNVDKSLNSIMDQLSLHPNLDILAFQLKRITEEGRFISYECQQPLINHNAILAGRDAIIQGYMPSSVCALAIRKQLMINHKLFFRPGITQQDVELSYRLFAHAKDVFFSDLKPYIYIHHPNSTSKTMDVKKKTKYECDKIEIIKSFQQLASLLDNTDKELANHIHNYAHSALFGCVYKLFRNRKKWKPLGVNQAVIQKLKANQLYPLRGPFNSFGKKLTSKLLNLEWLIS